MQQTPFFNEPISIMMVITLIPVFFIWLEKKTKWKLFEYLPAIIWIFLTPIALSNLYIIPKDSPVYSTVKSFAVPMFIVLMLLDIDIRQSLKIAWRSTGVLIIGCVGVVAGAAIAFLLLNSQLAPDAWAGFGALAGSWIGGSGNLAAVADSLELSPEGVGMAVLVDNIVYVVYFPIILMSKKWAVKFNKFSKVSQQSIDHFRKVNASIEKKTHEVHFTDVLTLLGFGFAAIFISNMISEMLPALPPVFTSKTWAMLLVTTIGVIFSSTRLKKIPGTAPISMTLVYIYMTMMGAMADLSNMGSAHFFLLAGFICIAVHLIFVALAARIFKVDVSMAAIASVAAIGGAASGPVVAGYHNEEYVPVSIMLALIGYALGNYLGIATAYICHALV